MNYTPKPSSRITPSVGENGMKIRSVDFEFSAFRQTDRQTRRGNFALYIYINIYGIRPRLTCLKEKIGDHNIEKGIDKPS